MRTAILACAVLVSALSCQNLWETNLLEGWNAPSLPKSGEMANWQIDEFRSRMRSVRWTAAVINDTTLGAELMNRLNTLAGPAATKVEASLLMIRALSQVEGVPAMINRVVTHLFPELISSGLLNGFTPGNSAHTLALRNLVISLLGTTNTASFLTIIEAAYSAHWISASNLSVTAPGIDWYGSASLEELGQVAQFAVGAGLVYALYVNTTPVNTPSKIVDFLNSAGTPADLTANFNVVNLASDLQDLFNAMNKNANNTNPAFEHLERVGDLLPF